PLSNKKARLRLLAVRLLEPRNIFSSADLPRRRRHHPADTCAPATLFPFRRQQNIAIFCDYVVMGDPQLNLAIALLLFVFTTGIFIGYNIRAFISYLRHIEHVTRSTIESH